MKKIKYKGEELHLTQEQIREALRTAPMCKCGDCLCCYLAKSGQEKKEIKNVNL